MVSKQNQRWAPERLQTYNSAYYFISTMGPAPSRGVQAKIDFKGFKSRGEQISRHAMHTRLIKLEQTDSAHLCAWGGLFEHAAARNLGAACRVASAKS